MYIQDELLNKLKEEGKEGREITVFLTRGTKIIGRVLGADQFTILLDVTGEKQLIYKHAISTIVVEP